MALYKTSARDLYYILGFDSSTEDFDRCYSINTDNNDHMSRLILTEELEVKECYWSIEPVDNDMNEIRLK